MLGDTVYMPVAPSRWSALIETSEVRSVCSRGAVMVLAALSVSREAPFAPASAIVSNTPHSSPVKRACEAMKP